MSQVRPFGALNELHRELSRVFDNSQHGRDPSPYNTSNWAPHVDITESDSAFKVIADIPGVNPDEVEVTLHNNVLTIRGERDSEKTEENEAYKRRERIRGSFFRQFTLPETADENGVKAKANNGVLEVSIPKAAKPKPLNITVEGE